MRRHSLLAAIAVVLVSSSARADDAAAAEKLFDAGQQLMSEKKLAEACPKLAESVRLAPGLGAKLWLADCYEQNGQTASAWAEFRDAAALAARRKDPREKVARKRVEALEPSLAHVVIVSHSESQAPKLAIARDGVPLTTAVFGTPIPIDPGAHVFRASAAGYKTWETKITIANAKTVNVEVPPLEAEAVVTTTSSSPREATATSDGPNAQKIGGIAAMAVGVVGVGVGSYFGLAAKSNFDAAFADGHCKADADTCDPTGLALRRDAVQQATISTIAFVAGGVFLAGGAVLFFTAPSKTIQTGMGKVKVALQLSPTMAGIVATGF